MLENLAKETLKEYVNNSNVAVTIGSGTLNVYGTPAMALLVEKAAVKLLKKILSDRETSVGTKLEIEHISPTPIGMEICCEIELIEKSDRKFLFEFEVKDDVGLVGKGRHERFVVDSIKFQEKAERKLKK